MYSDKTFVSCMTVKTFFAVIQIAVCIINWLRKKNETCSFVHTDRTLINV